LVELSKFDVLRLLSKKGGSQEWSSMNINFEKTEIFLLNHEARESDQSSKRVIVYPFSLSYKSRQYVSKGDTQDLYLLRTENTYLIDRIIFRLSPSDSFVVFTAYKSLEATLAEHKNIPPFPNESKNANLKIEKEPIYVQLKNTQTVTRVIQYGVQLVILIIIFFNILEAY